MEKKLLQRSLRIVIVLIGRIVIETSYGGMEDGRPQKVPRHQGKIAEIYVEQFNV